MPVRRQLEKSRDGFAAPKQEPEAASAIVRRFGL